MARTFTVHRTSSKPGAKPVTWSHMSARDCRGPVAWSLNDNRGWPRPKAAQAASRAPIDGTPYTVEDYTFTITPDDLS